MKKLLLFLFLLPTIVFGRKFYFSSSTGNDSYTATQAQNPATPWKTLAKISYYVIARSGNLGTLFQAGDTLAFKRGDIFDNGLNSTSWNGAVVWGHDTLSSPYYRAPSGTPNNPIVFTNYGDVNLALPNFYYALPAVTQQKFRVMFSFFGVHDIVVDGLQFNDTRFPYTEKKLPAYTYGGIELGQWKNGGANDTSLRYPMVTNAIVKNCVFSNMSFGFSGVSAINSSIINNNFSNFKGTEDTTGFTDVLGGAIEGLSGFRINISNNYIKGAWSGSGRVSDCYGLGGVGLDIFWCFKNSKIAYNTFVDCSGMFEVGNRYNDSANGAQYDTFAFNKIINCGQMGYIHGTAGDVFAANNHHLYFWNNVMISNNKDRFIGNGYGDDIYGDGQSFNNFWFFRSKSLCPNDFIRSGSVTNGSTVVTISTTNIKVGSRLYDSDEIAYKEVISVGTGQVTVNAPFATTNPTYSFRVYPPISDPNWSHPTNSALCNIGGHRYALQFPSDSSKWGLWADTMIETKNNIFYVTNGGSILYPNLHGYSRQRYFHRNNIYYVKGGFGSNLTTLGGTLGTGEFQTTIKLFIDTSAALPENWDLRPLVGSLGVNTGSSISGFTTDFAGNALTNPPSIGLYNYSVPSNVPTPPTVTTAAAIVGSATSATLGGNVTADGGATVYRRGVVYSTGAVTDTTNVGGGGKLIVTSTGLGVYSIPTATLVRGTVYYARAFALNSAGVSYGAEVSFTTLNIPTIATVGATAVTQTTAVSGGTISTDGNSAIIKRGLIYSTSAITDTSNGTKIVALTASTGAFSTNLSGLSANTLYHIRAYAYNAVGIAYGSDLTFTTSGQIISPITVSSTNTTIACNGDSSTVVISASGGTPPYTGTGTFTKAAGTHTFTVTDGYFNSGSKVVSLTQPTLIVATVTFAPVTTIGGTTTVTAASTGGTGTKLYAMDGGAYQSGTSFTGITAGAHTLSVTDGNACIVSKAFTVNTTTQATKSALKFKN